MIQSAAYYKHKTNMEEISADQSADTIRRKEVRKKDASTLDRLIGRVRSIPCLYKTSN